MLVVLLVVLLFELLFELLNVLSDGLFKPEVISLFLSLDFLPELFFGVTLFEVTSWLFLEVLFVKASVFVLLFSLSSTVLLLLFISTHLQEEGRLVL